MQELKPTSLQWSAPPDPSVPVRPESTEDWSAFLVALIVFGLLIFAGLYLLAAVSWNLWSILWIVLGSISLAIGGYGAARMLRSLFRTADQLQNFKLTDLQLEYELLPARAPLFEAQVRGQLRVTRASAQVPKSLIVSLELNPDFHADSHRYLNSQDAAFDSGAYAFNLDVPRSRTLLGDLHCLLELKFAAQDVFYRVRLEVIPQSAPLEIIDRPDRKAQLEAFATGDVDELIFKAYSGQAVSAGSLRHNGGADQHQFSDEEQAAVLTIRFAELVDYLMKRQWFAEKIRSDLAVKTNSYFILHEPPLYKVIYMEPDFSPFVHSEPGWNTVLHKTELEREAFEAFLLHSNHKVRLLRGAAELLEQRSDGDGAQHPQAH